MIIQRAAAAALLLAFGVVGQTGARADAAADARKSIQAIYAKRDAAEHKKDVNGSLISLGPNFVYVTKDGQKGDAALLKRQIAPVIQFMQSVDAKSEITKFSIKGKEATAIVKAHLEMLVLDPQTQAPQKIVGVVTSEDLWTKTDSGWLQKKMSTKSQTATLNGKSIDDQINLKGKPAKSGGSPKNKSAKKNG